MQSMDVVIKEDSITFRNRRFPLSSHNIVHHELKFHKMQPCISLKWQHMEPEPRQYNAICPPRFTPVENVSYPRQEYGCYDRPPLLRPSPVSICTKEWQFKAMSPPRSTHPADYESDPRREYGRPTQLRPSAVSFLTKDFRKRCFIIGLAMHSTNFANLN